MRQIFHSGYCFVIPTEEERELVREWKDEEQLKLGVDRIPAEGDVRYYDKFDRYGEEVEHGHFIIEEVLFIDVVKVNKTSGFREADKQWFEKVESIIKVMYKVQEYKEKNPALWEQLPLVQDVR